MHDDPKFIGGLMDWAYLLSTLILFSAPIGIPAGLAVSPLCPSMKAGGAKRGVYACLLLLGYLALCLGAWALIQNDPGRVIEWWFD